VLVPTLLLVLLVLGGIAVDLAVLHGTQRRAERVAAAAADDAAGMLDLELIQLTGELRIDPASARRVAVAHVDAAGGSSGPVELVDVVVRDDGSAVHVRLRSAAPAVMLTSMPGRDREHWVEATARARVHR
jgi:hypothetical protein